MAGLKETSEIFWTSPSRSGLDLQEKIVLNETGGLFAHHSHYYVLLTNVYFITHFSPKTKYLSKVHELLFLFKNSIFKSRS